MLSGKKSPDDILVLEMLSRTYGWTPSQIRAESRQDIYDYVLIGRLRAEIEKREQRRNRR